MAYTVKKGDSLSKIAASLGITWQELYEMNKDVIGSNPDLIKPGQTFKVPGDKPTSSGGGTTSDGKQDAGGVTTSPRKPGVPTAEAGDKAGVGAGELKILTAKKMHWFFDKSSGKWYVEYRLPNSGRSMVFEARPDQMDALFGKNRRPDVYHETTFKNLIGANSRTFGGDISEMEGTGSFEAHVARVTAIALDGGRLPDWAKESGVAMDIIYTAQAENKSTDWVIDQLSKTSDFKKRFPKIQKFISENNLTMAEGIKGFLEMEAGINQTLQSFGYENTMKKVSPEMVGNLLDKGFNLKTIQDTVGGFKRMKEFEPAMNAFNQILTEQGLSPMTKLQDILKFVQGKAPSEMYDLWEQSSIQEAAVGAGLGHVFSVQDAIDLSRKGDFTLESATQGMQKAAELLLRMRHEVDTGKFGLDHEELIDISLGATPRSGRPQAEILENVNRAVLSAQKSMQQKSGAFRSFSDEGKPQSASLRGLRSES